MTKHRHHRPGKVWSVRQHILIKVTGRVKLPAGTHAPSVKFRLPHSLTSKTISTHIWPHGPPSSHIATQHRRQSNESIRSAPGQEEVSQLRQHWRTSSREGSPLGRSRGPRAELSDDEQYRRRPRHRHQEPVFEIRPIYLRSYRVESIDEQDRRRQCGRDNRFSDGERMDPYRTA